MKCGYSATFPNTVNGKWTKIWAEEEFTGSIEDCRKQWYALKKEIENFYYESTKADEKKNSVPETMPVWKQVQEEYKAEDAIKSCTELKVLESYKFIVKGKPELVALYNNKLKELT